MKQMFYWNSLAFSMIQQMLAIWSLVPLPFLNPDCRSGGSVSIFLGSLGPGAHKVCLSPLNVSSGTGFDIKPDFASPTILLGLRLCSWMWGVFSRSFQHHTSSAPMPTICWGFSILGRRVCPQSHSSAAQSQCSCCSSAYHLAGASLPLDMSYLLTLGLAPRLCSRCSQSLKKN